MNNSQKPLIIGETAYNHQGDFNYLLKMIDDIAELKLDAVKFHLLLNPESYFQAAHPMIKSISDWMFTEKEWQDIIDKSLGKGLQVVALCDDMESLHFINKNYPDLFSIELHATSINDLFLLREAAKFRGHIILGIGGCTIDEIDFALEILGKKCCDRIILMYGFQNYPTHYADINLAKMVRIRDLFNIEVGYADHTAYDDPYNEIISCMGAMAGIPILEKHYTSDPGEERLDYHAAVGKEKMRRIKELFKTALDIFGDGSLKMSEAELNYGNTGPMKKAIVAREDIPRGSQLSLQNLWFKRTSKPSKIQQRSILNLLGSKVIQDIKKDEMIDYRKIEYNFRKPNLDDFIHVKKETK